VDLGQVAGTARKAKYRKRFRKSAGVFEKKVGRAVDGWFDNAFVGVDYPRGGFANAFDTFTGPAAADAHHQKNLMTNYGLRHKISGVTVTQRHVWIDVLAPGGVIAGATARFKLGFTTTGDTKRKVKVSGRLFLSRTSSGKWRVFGFDVTKGGAR
jgi:hypothetical protein